MQFVPLKNGALLQEWPLNKDFFYRRFTHCVYVCIYIYIYIYIYIFATVYFSIFCVPCALSQKSEATIYE
jgi:hypothetical protein